MRSTHIPLSSLLALLPGAERREVVLDDLKDGSLAALAGYPEKVLDQRWHAQTSYFERLQRDDPTGLEDGLRRLAADLTHREPIPRPGRASILAWSKSPH